MAGIVLHMLASVLCVLAPNIAVLGVARFLQGMGAAAAMVVAIAVVGDRFADSVAATVLSRLMLVLGVAPVLAPSLGAAVLLQASWHWVFAALVVLAGALLLLAALALPETLPVRHRRPLKVRSIAATYLELLRDARFVILVLVAALGMSGLFAYIAGASFVLQDRYGLDQQTFALVFGAGAVALDRRDAVQRRAADAVLSAGHRGVGAGGVVGGGGGIRRRFGRPCRRSGRFPAARLGDSGRDGPGDSQRASRSRCPGTPTPQAPRPRCWVPRSSASARRWRRWSACSETTSSRWPW